ncbi:MAG TPA: hypothetical protein VNT79_04590, partial [Phycisphaerae bacterium]|nr:hypothetical protein [Phycisphaerae bacterium]
GGTLRSSGTGKIIVPTGLSSHTPAHLDGTTELGPVTLNALVEFGHGAYVAAKGTLINTGTIRMTTAGFSSFFPSLSSLDAPLILTGGGTVEMSDHPDNYVIGESYITNVNNTIRGAGSICHNFIDMTNQGLIVADKTTSLQVDPLSAFTNQGTLRATNGATLVLKNGFFLNVAGVIDAQANSFVNLQNLTLQGGVLNSADNGLIQTGSALNTIPISVDPITIDGTLRIRNGHELSVAAPLVINGNLEVVSLGEATTLRLMTTTNLTGTGRIILGDHPANRIRGARLFNYGITIEGAGLIGDTALGIVNEGSIIATGTNPLIIDPTSATQYNDGLLRASGSGGLRIAPGNLHNRNQLIVDEGSLFLRDGQYRQVDGTTEIGGAFSATSGYDQDAGETMLQGGTLTTSILDLDGGSLTGEAVSRLLLSMMPSSRPAMISVTLP